MVIIERANLVRLPLCILRFQAALRIIFTVSPQVRDLYGGILIRLVNSVSLLSIAILVIGMGEHMPGHFIERSNGDVSTNETACK